ncbi:MAG: hypothetical protein VB108_03465 [Anaerolineaceae bacterium]|nr:hypothetical protein [Anaerolineaceae bacterium]
MTELFRDTNPLINKVMAVIGFVFYALMLLFLGHQLFFKIMIFQKRQERFLLFSLFTFAFLCLFVTTTRIGLQPDSRYWNVAGVPVLAVGLASILLFIILIDSGLQWLSKQRGWKLNAQKRIMVEALLIFGIWALASLLWIKTPFSNSMFFFGPLPPDGSFLPKSDARTFDLSGQYMIIGSKLETPFFAERPFYSFFLGLLRFFFGQSYLINTNIQILLLAFFPVCLYLLGKRFAGWLFGLSLAAFAILKEFTALLFTFKISVSNSRLMMTEFPTALLLLLACLLIFKWLSEDKNSLALPLSAGGILGVATFVRSNTLVVIGIVFLFMSIVNLKKPRFALARSGIFLLGAVLVIMPWTFYTRTVYHRDPLTWKIEQALIHRFTPDQIKEKEPSAEEKSIPQENEAAAEIQSSTPEPPDGKTTPAAAKMETLPTPKNPPPNGLESIQPGNNNEDQPESLEEILQETPALYKSKVKLVLGHFLNNEIKALFILPFQIYPQKPTLILEQEYWREPVTWAGSLPPEQKIAFLFNLVLLSIGLSESWKQFRWAGLAPLIFNLSYFLSNALVRTSGSRYLIPIDWTVYFYYLLGLWCMLSWVSITRFNPKASQAHPKENKFDKKQKVWLTAFFFLAIGLSLPLVNLSFPKIYNNESKEAVLKRLPMQKIEAEIGINQQAMQAFFNKPNTVFLYGKGIYPGYLTISEDPPIRGNTFKLLTPKEYDVVVSDGQEPKEALPNGEDMIVLGCQHPGEPYIDSYLAYFVQSDRLIWSTTTTFRDICP